MKKALYCLALLFLAVAGSLAGEAVRFDDIIGMLQTNVDGMTRRRLEDSALEGIARNLRPRVIFETNEVAMATEGPLSARMFGNFACVRVGRVAGGLAGQLSDTIKSLVATNHVKGLVLDLRFSRGDDFRSASAAANIFIADERPLLSWPGGDANSTANAGAVTLPLAILVNKETAGAAEAMAAALRDAKAGLVIGSRTAGQAYIYKEFSLEGGRVLKVAGPSVEVAHQGPLSPKGLSPDVPVDVAPQEERLFYADPYRVPVSVQAAAAARAKAGESDDDDIAVGHRLNEAELVRLQKEGISPGDAITSQPVESRRLTEADLVRQKKGGFTVPAAARERALTDPALSRALDLLKALAVVRSKPA
jgi:hypothetical protein